MCLDWKNSDDQVYWKTKYFNHNLSNILLHSTPALFYMTVRRCRHLWATHAFMIWDLETDLWSAKGEKNGTSGDGGVRRVMLTCSWPVGQPAESNHPSLSLLVTVFTSRPRQRFLRVHTQFKFNTLKVQCGIKYSWPCFHVSSENKNLFVLFLLYLQWEQSAVCPLH